jgi:hypothetical protein
MSYENYESQRHIPLQGPRVQKYLNKCQVCLLGSTKHALKKRAWGASLLPVDHRSLAFPRSLSVVWKIPQHQVCRVH